MNKFISGMRHDANKHRTINGGDSYKSTNSYLLDLFASVGGKREKLEEARRDFRLAFKEDNLLALKLAFYSRNIRGGLGERDLFRTFLYELVELDADALRKNLLLVPHFGRWDDLFVLIGTKVEDDVFTIIKGQLMRDAHSETPSLLAKWMPSANASSKDTRKLAKIFISELGLTEKKYRKLIVGIRKTIKLVETQMSSGQWEDIEYGKVPSRAMATYRNAFRRHDEDGFEEFIGKVEKGEEKVNAGTLYPYDILKGMGLCTSWGRGLQLPNYDKLLEAQWNALPNFIEGENNILVMADTSASMTSCEGRPLATAVGLAIYFGQRNYGAFSNTFMTFSSTPQFVQFEDNWGLKDICEKIPSIVSNTDIGKAFRLILKVAIENGLSNDDLPKALVVVSDLGFDRMTDNSRSHNSMFEKMEKEFAHHGYTIPNVIFWNVNDTNSGFQVASDKKGVQMASGHSPSVFKSVIANIGKTPYQAMVDTLSVEDYDCVTI